MSVSHTNTHACVHIHTYTHALICSRLGLILASSVMVASPLWQAEFRGGPSDSCVLGHTPCTIFALRVWVQPVNVVGCYFRDFLVLYGRAEGILRCPKGL